jgi:transposase
VIAPFAQHAERLDEITGVGVIAAQELIAEIGVDVTRFPTAGHRGGPGRSMLSDRLPLIKNQVS